MSGALASGCVASQLLQVCMSAKAGGLSARIAGNENHVIELLLARWLLAPSAAVLSSVQLTRGG
jgi:hypothetical protein